MPLSFTVDGKPVPVDGGRARRARTRRNAEIDRPARRIVRLAIPSAVPNTLTLNFRGLGRDIPTYSFADLRACVEKGDKDFFRRAFDGKVVLFGTVLDVEDRKMTSKRFRAAMTGAPAPAMRPARPDERPRRRPGVDIAGVFVHATAVRNLIERDAVTELGFPMRTVLTFVLRGAHRRARHCVLAPGGATIARLGLAAACTAAAVGAFVHALALPLTEPLLAGLAALALMIGYRFVHGRPRRAACCARVSRSISRPK